MSNLRHEAQNQASEAPLSSWIEVAEAIDALVLLANAKGEIVHANQAAKEFFIQKSPVAPLRITDFLAHFELHVRSVEKLAASMANFSVFSEEVVLRNRNGLNHWLRLSVKPLQSAHGLAGFVLHGTDITDKKQQEHQLRRLNVQVEMLHKSLETDLTYVKSKLSAVLENTDELICSLDRDYRLLIINTAYRKRLHSLGIDPRLGENFVDQLYKVMSPERVAAYRNMLEVALQGEQIQFADSEQWLGKTYYFSTTLNPLKDNNGHIKGIVFFSKDITASKQAELKLREREMHLRELNKELDTLLYHASHDIKAPVASIKGLLNLLYMEQPPSEMIPYVEKISSSVDRLDQIIHTLEKTLDIKNVPLHISRIEVDDFLSEVMISLGWIDEDRPSGLTISNLLDGPLYGDQHLLHLLLRHLLDNAQRFSRHLPESFIKLSLQFAADNFLITVADNGEGIAPQFQHRVFDMFFRASEKSTGFGLGLYVAKKIAEKMKGHIALESEVNIGTTVTVVLPKIV